MFWVVISTIFALIMMTTIAIIRIKTSHEPSSKLKIILPPLFMSTGALMFIFPYFRVSWIEVLQALGTGVLFSILLIRTSMLKVKESQIYLIPSKSFIYILFGLIILRTVGKLVIGSQISVGETGGIFYLLGFGMIFTWRLVILVKFIRLEKRLYN